jgi:phosphoserine phosphatase
MLCPNQDIVNRKFTLALRAVFFDLDGTLKINRDPYHFIHKHVGFPENTQQVAAMFKSGEIDSDEWIRRDVALWRGLRRSLIVDLVGQIPYAPGAKATVRELKSRRATIAIVSTGLQIHADVVKTELGLDYAIANEIIFEGEVATGEAIVHVHEADKASIVSHIMEIEKLSPDECLAVGDGESDIGMFAACRIGVAIRPMSTRVRQAADIVFENADLGDLLPAACALVPEWKNV